MRATEIMELAVREGLDANVFTDFIIIGFEPSQCCESYVREWVGRFKTGNPRAYMDLERRAVFDKLIGVKQ